MFNDIDLSSLEEAMVLGQENSRKVDLLLFDANTLSWITFKLTSEVSLSLVRGG